MENRVDALAAADAPFVCHEESERLREVANTLQREPALVPVSEIEHLRGCLAKVADGAGFILQLGDCAERFEECDEPRALVRFRAIDRVGAIAEKMWERPVVRLGRFAGQFMKSRSSLFESRDGVTLPNYFGDALNGSPFDAESRAVDPERLRAAYGHAATALRAVRPHGLGVRFFSSHEAACRHFEVALERGEAGRRYATSAHTVWIGERNREPSGPLVRWAAQIENPVAVKLGPRASADEVVELTRVLNPSGIPGRLTLVSRVGGARAEATVGAWVEALGARRLGTHAIWICDPMHGNTTWVAHSKRRYVADIVKEVRATARAHASSGSRLAGLHLEMGHDEVAECAEHAGASEPLREPLCDPRLTPDQAVRVCAALVSRP